MGSIVPAILCTSRSELEQKLTRILRVPEVDAVQIDVVDGKFAAPATWPYVGDHASFADLASSGALLPHVGRARLEVDLMTYAPEETIGAWIAAGVSRITVHAEGTTQLARLISEFQVRYGHDKDFAPDLLSLGLAIGLETDVALIEPFLSKIDYVQFMGIAKIGRQGQPFDSRVIARIRTFRAKHPDVTIQIDGGVTEATAPLLFAAGADRLIVGHTLLEAKNMRETFLNLSKLTEKYGRYE